MMSDNILLSIVIPTLNRYETLLPLIKSLCKFKNNNFEIVVQDNSIDNAHFLNFYKEYINDNRIKYFYDNSSFSAIENCDLAVKKAIGKFICFIGDDDGVAEEILLCCEWMEKNDVESVFFNRAIYTWPQTNHYFKFNNSLNGKLLIPKTTGLISRLNVEREYSKIYSSGGQGMFNAPRLYHGIIAKSCLDELYSNLGTYFPGPVPDMSNCIALSKYVKSHYFIDIPLVITGQSSKSMSGKNAVRKHQGEISKEKSLPETTIENWDKRIPFYWSGPTIWAQASIEASKKVGIHSVIKYFNFANMYAYCFAFTSKIYFGRIFNVINNQFSFFQKIKIYLLLSFYMFRISFIRLFILLKKLSHNNDKIDFHDIESVIDYLNVISNNKMSIFNSTKVSYERV